MLFSRFYAGIADGDVEKAHSLVYNGHMVFEKYAFRKCEELLKYNNTESNKLYGVIMRCKTDITRIMTV